MNFFINYPSFISPIILGHLRWYSLMYLVALLCGILLLRYMVNHKNDTLNLNAKKSEDIDLLMFIFMGLLLGARLGSCFFYSGTFYFTHPHLIFWPFRGCQFTGLPGMSYHGGVLGVIAAGFIYAKKKKKNPLSVYDTFICCVPFSYTFGRLGNFLNRELYGKVTLSSLGMYFPEDSTELFSVNESWVQDFMQKANITTTGNYVNLPRHPSQLYEALFEGIVLGLIMWFIIRPNLKKMSKGAATGVYLALYSIFRFLIEYTRQPDADIGYVVRLGNGSDNIYMFSSVLNLSLGQIFCIIQIIIGLMFIIIPRIYYKKKGKQINAKRNK